MLKKIKNLLVVFSTLTIGAILLVMTGFCLIISERGIRNKNYADFQRNTGSLLSYLGSQSVITDAWLSEMEHNYHMVIDIRDGEHSLLYGNLRDRTSSKELVESIRSTAIKQYGINPEFHRTSSLLMQCEAFHITDANGEPYFAAAAITPRSTGYLDVVLLSPQTLPRDQVFSQRLLFGSGALISWLILSFLGGYFIRRMLKPIEDSHLRQTQFIASASHELRTPLTVMMSSLSAARIAPDEQREHFFRIMESEGKRMARLIQDMLVLANSDNHSWSIRPEPTELDTLMVEIYDKYQLIASQKKMPLTLALPDTETPLAACCCDKERISQVLCILIENAFSYGAGKTLDLSLALCPKYYEIRVTDHGPGIPDEEKSRIFERFYRSDTSHNDRSHFGLGLCIAHEIVAMHRGTLTVTDTPGGGAAFSVMLPVTVKSS